MTGWAGPGGPDQPNDQPFAYQDPASQQPGWPGGFQQPSQLQPSQLPPVQQFSAMPPPGSEAMIGGEPVMVTIGDISVTSTAVYTPSGSRSLSEVSWTFTDMSVTSQNIPTWAIVCAIVFFVFCLLGLLFLLAKENSTTGAVQVTVHGPGFVHTTTIPVSSVQQIADINARVNYVRTLTASFTGQQALGQPQAPGLAQPGQAQPGQAQPGQAQPGQAQPGQQWPAQAQPGQQWPGQAQPGQAQPGQQWPPQQGWQPSQEPPPGQQDQQPGQSW
jgi:hypothetical protein